MPNSFQKTVCCYVICSFWNQFLELASKTTLVLKKIEGDHLFHKRKKEKRKSASKTPKIRRDRCKLTKIVKIDLLLSQNMLNI